MESRESAPAVIRSTSVSSAIERRLSRVEAQVAKRLERVKICNCKVVTRHHNANCLRAILNASSRECPVHGFRDFGFLWQVPNWVILSGDDDQFCSCPEHPWRSFVPVRAPGRLITRLKKLGQRFLMNSPILKNNANSYISCLRNTTSLGSNGQKSDRELTSRQEILELNLDDVTRKNGE
jgi:hypothetical protein